jgi:hypothetical protein
VSILQLLQYSQLTCHLPSGPQPGNDVTVLPQHPPLGIDPQPAHRVVQRRGHKARVQGLVTPKQDRGGHLSESVMLEAAVLVQRFSNVPSWEVPRGAQLCSGCILQGGGSM